MDGKLQRMTPHEVKVSKFLSFVLRHQRDLRHGGGSDTIRFERLDGHFLEMTQMSGTSRRRKATTSKPLANPKLKHDLFGQATKLVKVLNSKDTLEPKRILTMKKEIDIPKLETAIARYRRAIALQSCLLDELEVLVKEVKRNVRNKTPAKSKKRK